MIFDGHADIWTDVNSKRISNKEDDIFKKYHLNKFDKGNIMGGIFVVWVDPPYKNDPAKRTMDIFKNMSVEITNNKDILHIVKSYEDIEIAVNSGKKAVLIGMEGLSSIGSDLDILNLFYLYGVRHASLTWNEENDLATGVLGNPKRGLSEHGFEAVKRLESLGIIVDVSHTNERTFWDIEKTTTKPFIASHSNCRSICDVPRNLTDEQLLAIANSGGLVGLNSFCDFIDDDPNKRDLEHLVDHLDHMINIMGIDHVSFGFDFCDYIGTDTLSSFSGDSKSETKNFEDASKASSIIDVLKSRGYSDEYIKKISYENYFNLFKKLL